MLATTLEDPILERVAYTLEGILDTEYLLLPHMNTPLPPLPVDLVDPLSMAAIMRLVVD